MRRTRSDPIQFRLMLEEYAVLERLAADAGQTPKDYVVALTLAHLAEHTVTTTTTKGSD